MSQQRVVTIDISGFGSNISAEEIEVFFKEVAQISSIKLGYNRRQQKRRDYVIIKALVTPSVLAKFLKDCKYKDQKLISTITRINRP